MLAPTAYEARLADLLARVSSGEVSPGDAARELRDLPFSDLGFAKVDHHRELRQGACEIVYAEGKTPEEVRSIVERLLSGNEGPPARSTSSSPTPSSTPRSEPRRARVGRGRGRPERLSARRRHAAARRYERLTPPVPMSWGDPTRPRIDGGERMAASG